MSAFAPITAPSRVPWGQKAFAGYLGDDAAVWAAHDATSLVTQRTFPGRIRIDQGLGDKFLGRELRPEVDLRRGASAAPCRRARAGLTRALLRP